MRAFVLAGLLLSPAAAQELDLSGIVRKVERRTATDLVLLGLAAERDDLHATARRIFLRALTYDESNRIALRKLEDPAGKDADEEEAKKRLARAERLAEKHLKTVVRVCVQYADVEERAPIIEPLLLRMPRRADLHEALGHVKVGRNYARPGMVEMLKLMPLRLQAWRSHATQAVSVGKSDFVLHVPGLEKQPAFLGVAGCAVGTTLDASVAESVVRTQAFLRFLLGGEADVWKPSPVLFLEPKDYTSLVRALHESDDAFKLYHRFDNYEHKDFYAIRSANADNAAERYAHGAGYFTMYAIAAAPDKRAFAWLLEGFGYLMSLELFDRGYISVSSIYESAGKRKYTRAVPARKTRAACLQWLREQIVAEHVYPLREVLAKSVNNLDFCASMQAYTLLRFLFLLDPNAARKLPAALRRAQGTTGERAERALRELFGKGVGELEPLWRSFLLEIE